MWTPAKLAPQRWVHACATLQGWDPRVAAGRDPRGAAGRGGGGAARRHGRRWVGDSAGGLRSAAINTEATLSMSVGALPTGDKLENPRDVYFQGRANNALFGAVRLLFRAVRSAAVRACPAE
eukprot:gene24826-biopygen17949